MPYLAPVNTSNELEDFDPLISRSQPAVVAPEDSHLNSQLVESEVKYVLLEEFFVCCYCYVIIYFTS